VKKDAYDIYSICDYYKQGPVSVANEVRHKKDIKSVREGLEAIRERFRSPEAEGPSWVVNFMVISDEKEKQEKKQRSFMVVDEMLRILGI